ncbi:MAG: M48 family metalloprotease [Pseudobdellovibrionaceae bacterium]
MKNRFLPVFVLLAVLMLGAVTPARAQSIIRDTEIENDLKGWTSEIFRAAGLSPSSVNFILIQDTETNAFVAGGMNIFIYTGLIDKTENLDELLGVIAHETGHIAGGHLVRTREAMEAASYEAILGTVLGLGTAIATGQGEAAGTLAQAGNSMATSSFLSHSRIQESSADQAGFSFLDSANIDPEGLLTFLQKMEDQELLPQTQQTEYMITHPLSRNRIDALQGKVKSSSNYGKPLPSNWVAQYQMMKAKLTGFISPERVIWDYPDQDTSLPARYARTIAAYRQHKTDQALKMADGLIASQPDNAYFYELKAQILSESGQMKSALPIYKTAIAKAPSSNGLIRIDYSHALIESAGSAQGPLNEAISQLKLAQKDEKRSPRLHRLMATAYGRLGDEPRAGLHLAEEALLQGRKDYAKQRAQGALNGLPSGSADWYRAQDLLKTLE